MIEDGGLPRTECALRLMKSNLKRAASRRQKGRLAGRCGVTNLHVRLNRLPPERAVEEAEIGDLTLRLH